MVATLNRQGQFKIYSNFTQCLFMKKSADTIADDKWYDTIFFPYWQFININGQIMHVYELDRIEILLNELVLNKKLNDAANVINEEK
jgi:hypothetical protein